MRLSQSHAPFLSLSVSSVLLLTLKILAIIANATNELYNRSVTPARRNSSIYYRAHLHANVLANAQRITRV